MSRIPMYRQIAHDIKQQIEQGTLSPGDALPTEAQLREDYAVSRVTVRQALKLLIDQDVVESIQGSGTYVKEVKVNYDIYQMTSFYEKLSTDTKSYSEILAFEIMQPDISIAEILSIADDDRVYYVKRVRFIEDNPVALEETWMPLSLFPDLTFQVMQRSKYEYIEKIKGMNIDYSEQEIVPIIPSDEVVEHLKLENKAPILEKITTSYLDDGRIFEFSKNSFKSAEYKFTLIAKRGTRK